MGWWIVKQPNGRLARFSDVLDNFTHMNMTEPQAVDLCRMSLSMEDALYKVELGMEDGALSRWTEALRRIEEAHGDMQRTNAEKFDQFADEA